MPYRPFVILLALLVLAIAPLGARAEESPVKLGLTPVDVDGSYFELELQPGDVEVLTVEFASFGEEPLEIRSFVADAYSLINGGFGARLIDEPKTGSTHWLDYTAVDDLTLEPEVPVLHTFAVEVPKDATPGDYLTSIVIQTAEPVAVGGEDSNIVFNQTMRQAVAVAIDIPGPREPELAIPGDITHIGNLTQSSVRIGIENSGNQHLAPLAIASVEDLDGTLIHEQEIEMDSVYAGAETAVELNFSPALEPGDFIVNLELNDEETGATASAEGLPFTVEAPPEPEPAEDTGVTGLIQPPRMPGDDGSGSWLTLIAMISVVALLAAIIGVMLGRRRARANAGPAAPVATAEPAASPTMAAQTNVSDAPEQQEPAPAPAAPAREPRSGGLKPLLPKRGMQ